MSPSKNKPIIMTLLIGLTPLILSGCHHHPDQAKVDNQTEQGQHTSQASSETDASQMPNERTSITRTTTDHHSSSEASSAHKHVEPAHHFDEKQNHPDHGVTHTIDKRNVRATATGDTPHSTRERQRHPLRASDCTSSHWTRVSCKNNDNACIAHQIDLMGLYERCRKAGLLEHH